MATATTKDLWKLLLDSQLLSKDQGKHLNDQFKAQADASANANTLAKWLVKQKAITKYQAQVLLSGKSGPFYLGGYIIEDRIKEGPFKGVYQSKHVGTSHKVLMHYVAPSIAENPTAWEMLKAQCQARCASHHANLLRCFELVDVGGKHFLVTEFPDGNPLSESRPGEGQPIPTADSARLARQAAQAIEHLHQIGLLHGHLNPNHLWLQSNGNLKLIHSPLELLEPIDWANQEKQAALLPLADYAAPELTQAGAMPTTLTDVYTLGCLLFDLLTGNPPYHGGDVAQKLARHAKDPIAQPEFVPQPMLQAISYMMAKNPGVRYQHIHDAVEALTSFVDPSQLTPPVATAEPSLVAYVQSMPQQTIPAPAVPTPPTPVPPAPAPVPPVAGAPMPPAPMPPVPALGAVMPGQPPMPVPPVPPQPGMMMPPQPGMVPPQPVMPVPGVPVPGMPMPGMPVPGVPAPGMPMAVAPPMPAAQPGYPQSQNLSPGSAAAIGTSRAEALTERVRKRKKIKKITNLIILAVLAIALVSGALYVWNPGNDPGPGPVDPNTLVTTDPGNPGTDPNTPVVDPGSDTGPKLQLVADDNLTLWNSPTSGEPLSLDGLAPGTRAVISVKLASLTATPEGARVLQGLGPKFDTAKQSWEAATGFKFEQVEQLLIGFSNATQPGQPCMVVTLKSPANFASSWGNPAPFGNPGEQYYKVNGWAMYPLPTNGGKSFAMSSEQIIMQVAGTQGSAPMLTRELEQLRRDTDTDRTFNLLIDPNFMSAGASQMLPGEMAALQPELEWFFGAGIQGAYLSANLSEHFYIESRYYGTLDNEPAILANTMRQRLSEVSKKLNAKIFALNAAPYWRNLAGKFPPMIEYAYTKSRSGAEDNQAIVNTVLPAQAAQNLIAASVLQCQLLPPTLPQSSPRRFQKN